MKIRELVGLLAVVACVTAACSGSEAAKPAAAAKAAAPAVDHKAQGEAVAKEILATFAEAVAEAATLVKDKPAPAAVKPKLEALYAKYQEKMAALNVKRRALTEPEARLGASGWMDEHRGKAVFDKDNVLGSYIFHYTNEVKDADVAGFLNTRIVTLIDVGDAH